MFSAFSHLDSPPGNRYFLIMSSDNSARADTVLRRVFIACVLCLALFQFSENTADPDLWGHVIYGNHLIQTGQLMRADPYSWTAAGHEWVNHEILAEAAMALSFRALGGPGLLLLTIIVGFLTFLLAILTASKKRDLNTKIVTWAFGALAVVEISFGFAARPQIFTALALAIQVWALKQFHQGNRKWAFLLPPLFVLWINAHGGAIVGVVLLFAAAGATTVEIFFAKTIPKLPGLRFDKPLSPKSLFLLWLIAIISAAALLANPYGPGLIRWLIASITWLRPQIAEWNPVTVGWDHAAFFFCVAFSALAFVVSRQPKRLWEIAILLLLAAMGFRAVRNTPLFCIAALALVPSHLTDALTRFQKYFTGLLEVGRRAAAKTILTILFLLLSIAILASSLFLHKERAWTMEVPRAQYPTEAIKFIQQHDLHGNLLVYFDWGEECLWELPDSRVSIDGRLDTCYPNNVIAAHWQFYNDEPYDTNALNIAQADFALLPSHLAGALALAKKDGWHPVYLDGLAVVLVKNLDQFPKLDGLQSVITSASMSAGATEGRAAFPNHLPAR
ncbi:MAG TPA: hypothetical protein VGN23_13750 [Verrucomicrobiae bacterium]|jgi:hypothetical protein